MTIRFHLFDSYFKTKTNQRHTAPQRPIPNAKFRTIDPFDPLKTAMAAWQHCRLLRADWSLWQWRRRGCQSWRNHSKGVLNLIAFDSRNRSNPHTNTQTKTNTDAAECKKKTESRVIFTDYRLHINSVQVGSKG